VGMLKFCGSLFLLALVALVLTKLFFDVIKIVDWVSFRRRKPLNPPAVVSTPAFQRVQATSVLVGCFGWALEQLKAGKRLARAGWNGKGLWIKLQVPVEHSKMTLPYIYIEYPVGHPAYPNGSRVPWVPSQTDQMAEDWFVLSDDAMAGGPVPSSPAGGTVAV
jgi:hypothetical protein